MNPFPEERAITRRVRYDDIIWHVRAQTDDHLAASSHESLLWDLLVPYMGPGRVFLDIGAHVGRYTLRAAKLGTTVHAFEPNPPTLQMLELNLEANPELVEHVHVHGVAVSNVSHEKRFLQIGEPGQEGHTRLPIDGAQDGGTEPHAAAAAVAVKTLRVDDMSFPLGVHIVKVDVEGHERAVLEGMMDIIRTFRPVLLIELHHDIMPGVPNLMPFIEEKLAPMGYSWATHKYGPATYAFIVPPTNLEGAHQ